MADQPCIVGLGEVLWDELPNGRRLGGAPANFAHHCRTLGAEAHVVSAVGDDADGRAILQRLDALGLGRECCPMLADYPTGTVSVTLSPSGSPEYVIHEDVAWDAIPVDDAALALAQRADVVCFGSLARRSPASRTAINTFLKSTRPECLRIFDVNLRQHYFDASSIAEALGMTSVCKLNDEEAPRIAGLLGMADGSLESIGRSLLKRFDLRLVALTRGADGSMLISSDGVSHAEAAPVDHMADTVGAGDAFTAAMAIGLLAGREPNRINTDAGLLAAWVCSHQGGTPDPSLEIVARLRIG